MSNDQEQPPKETNPEVSPTLLDFEEENEESARIDAARARRIADEGASTDAVAPADEDDAPEEVRKRQPSPRRTSFKNAREVLLEEVPLRAQNSSPTLRSQLLGTVSVEIDGTQERYFFDWSSDNFRALDSGAGSVNSSAASAPDSGAAAPLPPPDCSIRLNQSNLLKIAAGDLNPQVAMLSSKIRVTGRSSLAIYFFNLVAPRQNY